MAREEALGPGGERVYCRPQGVWWCLCLEEGLRKGSHKVRSQGSFLGWGIWITP